jgi:hypothetical protein
MSKQNYYQSSIIATMQLELFNFDELSQVERRQILTSIRNSYWHLRNLRGARWGQAKARRQYRLVADQKNACC